jgi:hypothetical protein
MLGTLEGPRAPVTLYTQALPSRDVTHDRLNAAVERA